MLLLQHESGQYNWVSNVQKLLCENGFGIVWLCQGVGCEYGFINELKDRLISCYKQDWHSDIESSDKYSWFFAFKNIFQTEKYLSFVTDKWHRISLTRFRLRVSGLKNCKRWFQNENLTNDVMCPSCRNATEDEVQFLFHCSAYTEKRKCSNILNITIDNPDHAYVARLLSSGDENTIKSIAKFVADAMNVRKKIIDQTVN